MASAIVLLQTQDINRMFQFWMVEMDALNMLFMAPTLKSHDLSIQAQNFNGWNF